MLKKYKSAVGAVICNCEKYIQEWCCFQYLTGFDKIIICLDRCTDDTFNKIQGLPYEVLSKVDVFSNGAPRPDIGFQHRGYQSIYDKYKNDVEWLALFDDDEYLYDSRQRPINDILSDIPSDVGQLALTWIKYTHSGQMLSAPPTVTRLAHFLDCVKDYPLSAIKVIARVDSINNNSVPGSWYRCHSVDACGRIIDTTGKDVCANEHKIQTTDEQFDTCIAHYIHGAMEDWVIKYKKWKIEHDYVNFPNCTVTYAWKAMMNTDGTPDARMLIYVDRLKELLACCK